MIVVEEQKGKQASQSVTPVSIRLSPSIRKPKGESFKSLLQDA